MFRFDRLNASGRIALWRYGVWKLRAPRGHEPNGWARQVQVPYPQYVAVWIYKSRQIKYCNMFLYHINMWICDICVWAGCRCVTYLWVVSRFFDYTFSMWFPTGDAPKAGKLRVSSSIKAVCLESWTTYRDLKLTQTFLFLMNIFFFEGERALS